MTTKVIVDMAVSGHSVEVKTSHKAANILYETTTLLEPGTGSHDYHVHSNMSIIIKEVPATVPKE